MTVAITFHELSELINTYLEQNEEDTFDVETHPLSDGILINIKKFDTGSINVRGKLSIHYDSFEEGVLTIRLKFKNLFYELLKKLLMGIAMKIILKKMREENDSEDIDPTKFIHFRSNTVSAEVNNLFEAMNIPAELILVKQKEGSIAVAVGFVPERLVEDKLEE